MATLTDHILHVKNFFDPAHASSYLESIPAKKTFYVYSLRAENEGLPFYIGKGTANRINQHFKPDSLKLRAYRNDKIRYYQNKGIPIIREKLYVSTCEYSCLEMEEFLIMLYGRKDNGTGVLTNHTNGGDGVSGLVMSMGAKQKMRLAKIGKVSPKRGIPMSEEQKKKVSAAKMGSIPHNKGKKQPSPSESTKVKMKDSHNRRVMSDVGNVKYPREQAAKMVKEYMVSGLSLKHFSAINNIPQTTFQHWMKSENVMALINESSCFPKPCHGSALRDLFNHYVLKK